MKTYVCYLVYFATGEGMTYAVGAVYAKNKKEAKAKFCKKHMMNDNSDFEEETIKYFSKCVDVYDYSNKDNHPKIKEVMQKFFNDPTTSYVLSFIDKGLVDFYFKSYVNIS